MVGNTGVPYLADNSLLWCNTELFDRANRDVDEASGSFDGLLDAAHAIRKLGDDVYAWSFPGNSPGALGFVVQPMVWAAGSGQRLQHNAHGLRCYSALHFVHGMGLYRQVLVGSRHLRRTGSSEYL